jgi:superfamily I DNA/RNA helicase
MRGVRLTDLNPPQREAVTTVDGPLLVLAGAGSGKTRVITHRVAHLVERAVSPDGILAVSFTNKAAEEMQARVAQLVRRRGPTLCTFHALGLHILKAERAALGFPTGFTIYDASDQLGTVREIAAHLQLRCDIKAILFRISRAKNAFADGIEPLDEYDQMAADVYPRYQEALRSFHALDFDDLITETVRLFERDAAVRARWQSRFSHVMVDEYQDTNRAQFRLLGHLVAVHKNVCVVGDDDQSIYGWRGAESGHILDFERHFPGARVIKLEENYRSTPAILDAANALIAHNPKRHEKRLWTSRPPGEPIEQVVADDADGEAAFVADEIALLVAVHGYRPRDCAVLYRANTQSAALEEALRARRIAHRVVGGQAFFDRKEVKDAIAYLKLALHPRDEISLRRIINHPPRGIGAGTLERLAAHARARGLSLWDACAQARLPSLFGGPVPDGTPVEDLGDRARAAVLAFCDLVENGRALLAGADLRAGASAYLDAVGLRDELRRAAPNPLAAQRRLEHLEGLLDSLARFVAREGRDLGGFLHRLALETHDDQAADGVDAVTLVTLHGAKGLEFPVVFLVGLEEELLPHKRTLYPNGPDVVDAAVDLGEERRLFYVGITRARERLYLTRARSRSSRAAARPRSPSRFLDEIPAALCRTREAEAPAAASAADAEAFARASLAKLLKLAD